MNDKHMQEAIDLARSKMREKCGGPFGCIITKDGSVLAKGWNQVTSTNDPTAHAEITAIRNACKKLASFDLSGAVLYASSEPCPMCLAAIYWAGIKNVYYAATRQDAAKIGFADDFIDQELRKTRDQRTVAMTQIKQAEALAVFAEWDQMEDKILY